MSRDRISIIIIIIMVGRKLALPLLQRLLHGQQLAHFWCVAVGWASRGAASCGPHWCVAQRRRRRRQRRWCAPESLAVPMMLLLAADLAGTTWCDEGRGCGCA